MSKDQVTGPDQMKALDDIFDTQPWFVRTGRRFWGVDPFIVLFIALFLGVVPIVAAVYLLNLGDVTHFILRDTVEAAPCPVDLVGTDQCLEKQVGYGHALNWWPSLAVMMPLAFFFAFTSVQNLQRAFRQMIQDSMFCNRDWQFDLSDTSGEMNRGVYRMVRLIWTCFSLAGLVVALLVGTVVVLDWYCVVHMPLVTGDLLTASGVRIPAVCQDTSGQEVDWSIAAIFTQATQITAPADMRSPSFGLNWGFSAYVYAVMLIELCLLMVYYCYVLALALTIQRLRNGAFDVWLVPKLSSQDPNGRMGFENLEQIFRPCIYVTIISFLVAFAMRIQNEFLRQTEFENIYGFLFQDFIIALRSMFTPSLESFGGFFADLAGDIQTFAVAIDVTGFRDPNSLVGGPLVLIVLSMVTVVLAVILRDTAKEARERVGRALDDPGKKQAVIDFYGLDEATLRARLREMKVWPLSWPKMQQSIRMLILGVVCFVLYQVAFIWAALMLIQMLKGKLGREVEG